MKKNNWLISLALSGLFASAGTLAAEAPKCDLAADVEAVKAAHQQAKSVGGEWRDTAEIVKKAEKAAEGGDCEGAKKGYAKAKFQYEAGYKQAQSQANAGNPSYLKK